MSFHARSHSLAILPDLEQQMLDLLALRRKLCRIMSSRHHPKGARRPSSRVALRRPQATTSARTRRPRLS